MRKDNLPDPLSATSWVMDAFRAIQVTDFMLGSSLPGGIYHCICCKQEITLRYCKSEVFRLSKMQVDLKKSLVINEN